MCNAQGWGTELVCTFEALAHRIFAMLMEKLLPFSALYDRLGDSLFLCHLFMRMNRAWNWMLVLSWFLLHAVHTYKCRERENEVSMKWDVFKQSAFYWHRNMGKGKMSQKPEMWKMAHPVFLFRNTSLSWWWCCCGRRLQKFCYFMSYQSSFPAQYPALYFDGAYLYSNAALNIYT